MELLLFQLFSSIRYSDYMVSAWILFLPCRHIFICDKTLSLFNVELTFLNISKDTKFWTKYQLLTGIPLYYTHIYLEKNPNSKNIQSNS